MIRSLVFGLAILLAAEPAGAQAPRPSVLVLTEGPGTPPSAETFAEALLQGGRVRPVLADEAGVRLGAEGRIPQGAVELAEDALARGKDSLRLLDFVSAEVALADAVQTLRGVGTPEGYRVREEAEVLLGVVRLEAYRRDAALRTFLAVLARAPDFALDPVQFSPFVREAFEQARANVATLPRGRMRVTARPGSEVFIDGRSAGPAPVEVGNLVSAEHVVTVVAGIDVWSGVVDVPGGTVARVVVILEDTTRLDRARVIARAVGADRFVVLSRGPNGRVRGRVGRARTLEREASTEAELAMALEPALEYRAAPPAAPPPRAAPRRWYENWWVYAIGVGVIGGTVATVAVLADQPEGPAIEF